ncbi:MAG: glycosyltransferase family 61 protein [Cyanobacteria bacterium P01_A01_bin.40]
MLQIKRKVEAKLDRTRTKYFLQKNIISLHELYGDSFNKLISFPPETVATPEAVNLPFNHLCEELKSDKYTVPKIYTAKLEGVLYSPKYNILLTKSRKIILESIHPLNRKLRDFDLKSDFRILHKDLCQLKVKKISGYCSIFRSQRNSFAHAMKDNIPRTFLLNQAEYSNLDKIKLLYSDEITELEAFFLPNLIPSNVVLNSVSSEYLYDIENLIFPSFFHPAHACYFPIPYLNKLKAEMMPKRPRRKNKRIYISRIKCKSERTKRHILNESELMEEIGELGFERYILEDMSLKSQAELFYDAETIIGADGAGLFWTSFAEKAKVLVLFNRYLVPAFYYTIAKNLDHEYRQLCCSNINKNKNHQNRNFQVDIAKVLELLHSFSGDYK